MVVKLSGYTRSFFSLLCTATAFQWTGLMVVSIPAAIAQTTVRAEILLEPSDEESYKVFIARAEANAAVRAQSLFDQDLLRTEVRVTVLGQRSAAIAPVLQLRVSRQEWTAYPDPEIWSVYYPESKNLLLFQESPLLMEEEPDEAVIDEPVDELELPADEDLTMPEASPAEPVSGEGTSADEPMETEELEAEPALEGDDDLDSDPDREIDPAAEDDTVEETSEEDAPMTAGEIETDDEDEDPDDEDSRPSRTVPTLVR